MDYGKLHVTTKFFSKFQAQVTESERRRAIKNNGTGLIDFVYFFKP